MTSDPPPGREARYHPPVADARYYPRLRIHAHADVIGSEVVLARPLEDLSLGGCKLVGPAWEPLGQNVAVVLSFDAAEGAHLPLQGVVVRATEADLAIRFQNLGDEQRSALEGYIAATAATS